MKQQIIDIIGFGLEPELAELKAEEVMSLYKQRDDALLAELVQNLEDARRRVNESHNSLEIAASGMESLTFARSIAIVMEKLKINGRI